jgi:hypothetical protein
MVPDLIFTALRLLEIVTLIPIWGILAWFVNAYPLANLPIPEAVLELFIVAILGTVYCFFTFLIFRRWGFTPLYVAILDLGFFGALIAGVVLLAPSVRNTNCVDVFGPQVFVTSSGQEVVSGPGVAFNEQCLMMKSVWALAIVDIILFFFTAVAALQIWHYSGVVVVEERRHTHRRSYY